MSDRACSVGVGEVDVEREITWTLTIWKLMHPFLLHRYPEPAT